MMPTKPIMISFLLIFLLSFSTLKAYESPKTITVTTFNIRFFGLYPDSDNRDLVLQEFLNQSIPKSDIISFEEIVDVPRLKKLLPVGWDCLSYDHSDVKHLHVMLCHSPAYRFSKEPTDDNYLIDEVAGPKGNLRPAVTAIVTNLKGNALFRMVGVHLKALPEYSKARVAQTEIIANYLGKLKNSNLPVVIAGDFNTFSAPQNQETENDTDLILKTLNAQQLDMKIIANPFFTFRNSYGQGLFDHFYLSDGLSASRPLKIFDICNAATTTGTGTLDLAYYNKNISDHCPVSAEISL